MVSDVGPHRVDGISIFYRAIAGAVGGAGGALVIFLGVLLGNTILQSIVTDPTVSNPLATFSILAVLFVATLVSNGLGAFLIGLTDTDKYVYIGRGLIQILVVNVMIFLFTLPVYLVVKSIDPSLMIYVAAVQFIFTAMTSALVFEILASDQAQILLNLYSVIISIFAGLLLFVVIFYFGQQLVLFFTMPVILWGSIGFIGGIVSYFYYQMYLRSGVDFLYSEGSGSGEVMPPPDTSEQVPEEQASEEPSEETGEEKMSKEELDSLKER